MYTLRVCDVPQPQLGGKARGQKVQVWGPCLREWFPPLPPPLPSLHVACTSSHPRSLHFQVHGLHTVSTGGLTRTYTHLSFPLRVRQHLRSPACLTAISVYLHGCRTHARGCVIFCAGVDDSARGEHLAFGVSVFPWRVFYILSTTCQAGRRPAIFARTRRLTGMHAQRCPTI